MGRKVGWILSVGVLALTGVLGAMNGPRVLTMNTEAAFQRSVTIGVFVYDILGLAGAVGLARRRPWSVWVASVWAVVLTYVAATAGIAYGGPEVPVSAAVFGGVGCAIIAAAVVWSARLETRGP